MGRHRPTPRTHPASLPTDVRTEDEGNNEVTNRAGDPWHAYVCLSCHVRFCATSERVARARLVRHWHKSRECHR